MEVDVNTPCFMGVFRERGEIQERRFLFSSCIVLHGFPQFFFAGVIRFYSRCLLLYIIEGSNAGSLDWAVFGFS